MEQTKQKALHQVYQEFINTCMGVQDMDGLTKLVDENIFGYGSAADEKIKGIEGVKKLLQNQIDQSTGIQITWKLEPFSRFISQDENTAVYADDILMTIQTGDEKVLMNLRLSTVLNFTNPVWKVIHWHGSKPEEVESEKDTWGIENWKQKAEELERLVAEKTADLVIKNKELEVEAALERVRAMTMAMHSSADIGACILKMFAELTVLGVDERTRFGIGILNHENENNQLWTARKQGNEVNLHIGHLEMSWHPLLQSARKAWKAQVPLHRYVLEGEDLLAYYRMLNTAPDYKIKVVLEELPQREFHYGFVFEHGFFYAFTPQEFDDELIHISQRFSSQFEQTYRRYLDLQKAESQAREAQIEAALERVRSRSMAMNRTEELKEVIQEVFDQLVGINIDVQHAGFILEYKEREDMHIWLADHQKGIPTEITIPYFDSPHWNSYLEAKANQESFFANLLPFEVKNKFYRDLFKWIPELTEEAKQAIFAKPGLAISTVLLDNVGLYIEHYSEVPFSEEENAILMRFGKVFQQTYTRFLDLQKAETQAREAQIEAALERVRSRTLAMQHSEELAETAAVLFAQLISLGVQHERINIGIVSENEKTIEFWTTEQGGNLIKTSFIGSIEEPLVLGKLYWAWKKEEESLLIHLQGKDLKDWVTYCKETIGIPFDERDLGEHRFQTAAFFSKGMLMLTTPTPPPSQTMDFLIRFASVFNLTFTRFNDLKIAEAHAQQAEKDLIAIKEAKQKAEEALVELKSAQSQLIQAEKMASLGELTAGIAHEIQNPLNFVNNFSEVSGELIDEAQAEIDKGDLEEIKYILQDLKDNLSKINHHGKRAGSIVKGMLEHSRKSEGKKERTDLNQLADECLRLSFHGLRAKDKSFSADFKTSFDSDLPLMEVVSQDFGRVLLNLINNAFYAVNEKAKDTKEEYKPTVIVSSEKTTSGVELAVEDNGCGIPESIREKIFQPFFTTKPTGSGTGLGLSLSYDIIKAHGGELKVKSKEGEGTKFSIHLNS